MTEFYVIIVELMIKCLIQPKTMTCFLVNVLQCHEKKGKEKGICASLWQALCYYCVCTLTQVLG